MSYLPFIAAILVGFLLLIWGADRFINGAAALARLLGVSPLLIGLTIVGFGTSAPEVLVSIMAAWQGNANMAIGNAIGSNIANISLILAVTALAVPLAVHSGILRREYPIMVAVTFFAAWLMWDGSLTRLDGLMLLVALVGVLALLAHFARQERSGQDVLAGEFDQEIEVASKAQASRLFILGLLSLLIGSRILVWGAVEIATALGVSELVIGLTIIAIGTSLPELAAGISSALKGEHDMAVGNVIGSNIFNLLSVLPVPALMAPGAFDPQALSRDIPVMLGLTLALFFVGCSFAGSGKISRWEGLVLLLAFIGYQLWLYVDATQTVAAAATT